MSDGKNEQKTPKKQHPSSKEWAEAKASGEKLADVSLAGVPLTEDSYPLDTREQVAIWFSNNPSQALPNSQKIALSARKKPTLKETRLVYDSTLLNSAATATLNEFAEANGIKLIDIRKAIKTNLSPLSRQLLELAILELENMKAGGNPAAASDLIRWIPEIMGDGVYADIDLPVDPEKELAEEKAGLPVSLNMGSIVSNPISPHYHRQEACTINTDIIGYSKISPDRQQFIGTVGKELIASYTDPFTTLGKAKALICKTAGYRQAKSLFDLRISVAKCHEDSGYFLKFLGADFLNEEFSLGNIQLAQQLLDTLNPDDFFSVVAQQSKTAISLEGWKSALIAKLFKPLVEEISGPGAVYRAIGGANILTDKYRNGRDPSAKLGALEQFGCINKKTHFLSDNIVPWRTPEKEMPTVNKDGLSWLPDAQKILSELESPLSTNETSIYTPKPKMDAILSSLTSSAESKIPSSLSKYMDFEDDDEVTSKPNPENLKSDVKLITSHSPNHSSSESSSNIFSFFPGNSVSNLDSKSDFGKINLLDDPTLENSEDLSFDYLITDLDKSQVNILNKLIAEAAKKHEITEEEFRNAMVAHPLAPSSAFLFEELQELIAIVSNDFDCRETASKNL